MVALPSAHPLAGETAITPAALRDERFIVAAGQADAGLARVIWRICEKSGFTPVGMTSPGQRSAATWSCVPTSP